MTHLIILTGTIMQNTNIEIVKNQNHSHEPVESAPFVYTEVCLSENQVYQDQCNKKGELVSKGDHPKGSRRDYMFICSDPHDAHVISIQYNGKVYKRSITIEGVRATIWVCILKGKPGDLDEVNND